VAEIITMESLKAAQHAERAARHDREVILPYRVNGRDYRVRTSLLHGELQPFELTRPVGEMISTQAGFDALAQKVTIDLNLGRMAVPLLYQPIYRTIVNANFPKNVEALGFVNAQVIFVEKMELENVKLGTRAVATPTDTIPIVTYAAGFEWTEDVSVYDQTWTIDEMNRAFGEAYNALLNHIHLYPIIYYSASPGYPAKNKTPASTSFTTYRENLRATLRAGMIHAALDINTDTRAPRNPTILLAHSSMRWDLEEALARFTVNNVEYPALGGISVIIFYDGMTLQVGERVFTYPGCPTNIAYLIQPQRYFVELVKHDLMVDAERGDLMRLIAQQVVARARRGVMAGVTNAVEEVTLP